MAYVEVRCPNCSLPTPFNDERLQCYCINCGFSISKDSLDAGSCRRLVPEGGDSSEEDGGCRIIITSSRKTAGYTFFIDGQQVLRTVGGEDVISVTPGKHVLKVRTDLLAASADLDVSKDVHITVVTGFGGMKLKVS